MCEYDERLWEPMECQCGTDSCRKSITANDWMIPQLWDKYRGHFAPHVQRRIDAYRREHGYDQKFDSRGTQTQTEQVQVEQHNHDTDDYDDTVDDVSCVDRIMWMFGYARVKTRRYKSAYAFYHAKSQ